MTTRARPWQRIEGMFCAGGPVDGCGFCLLGGSFGAPGLVPVRLSEGESACAVELDDAGFVTGLVDLVRAAPANAP